LLTPQEEIALAKRIEQGDAAARQRLIEANYRLVFNIVNRYRHSGVPLEDLVQEGYIGLIQAVDRYDYRRACRFSTCATVWIRAHILQAIQRLKPLVHVPQRVATAARKVWRTAEQMAQELQRWPDMEELAAQMGLPSERVEELLGLAQEWISLDDPVGDEGDTLLLEIIADEDSREPAEVAIDRGLQEHVERSLKLLPTREREVLQMRFGLDGQREHTLAEIGKHFNLTRQRIKEIETSALNKLRCIDCPQRGIRN
jgi:RNA polymerase primary sigma factor